MNIEEIHAVNDLLNDPKNIVVIPHKNPDWDAIGATLALSKYLKKRNHQVNVIAPNDYPDFLKFHISQFYMEGIYPTDL